MTKCTQKSFSFPACKRRKVEANFEGGEISSDGAAHCRSAYRPLCPQCLKLPLYKSSCPLRIVLARENQIATPLLTNNSQKMSQFRKFNDARATSGLVRSIGQTGTTTPKLQVALFDVLIGIKVILSSLPVRNIAGGRSPREDRNANFTKGQITAVSDTM